MLTREEFDDVTLTLENEGKFYAWCQDNLRTCTAMHWFNTLKYFYRSPLTQRLCGNQIDWLKKYFEWRFFTDQREPSPVYKGPWKRADSEQLAERRHSRHYRGTNPFREEHMLDPREELKIEIKVPPPLDIDNLVVRGTQTGRFFSTQPEFNPMTPLKFDTIFTVNGHDVSKLSNADIYAAIEAEEARIEKLKQIKTQPKRLKAEIEAAEAQLKKLVEFLDSK